MSRVVGRAILVAAMLVAAAGCGYDTSATFNADGSVIVGLKFLLPRSLMSGTSGATVTGFSPSDIANANAQIRKQYPGARVSVANEGDETGAAVTIPFKTEKDAFAFLTQPPKVAPSNPTSGSGLNFNMSNTGGLFSVATHTASGSTDTYTFKTAPAPTPSPSPNSTQLISDQDLASVFTITFALTVPHVITSAPGALFTLDRKTAIWKLSWTRPQTLTATTGPDAGAVAATSGPLQDWRLLIAVGFIALAVGFLLGMLMTWRGLLRPGQHGLAAQVAPTEPVPVAVAPQPEHLEPVAWPSPPSEAPPPTKL